MPNKFPLTIFAILSLWATPLLAASYDCTKAQSKVERLVCDTPSLSSLDEKLAKDYQDVLAKTNENQKQQIIKDQRHWLIYTRNPCNTAACLKHAYWSRQAALQTWFVPRSPLYKHESDKVEPIKRILATATLYRIKHSDQKFCGQMLDNLRRMKGIRLVDPIVQAESYEDPVLDPWKQNCQTALPFNAKYYCGRNIEATGNDIEICHAGYGLPPFKLYELPPAETSGDNRYIFYADDAYGPMNRNSRDPSLGGGPAGFWQIDINTCQSAASKGWGPEKTELRSWARMGVFTDAGQEERNSKDFNGIFEYKNKYYFLILHNNRGNYWLSIGSTAKPMDDGKPICSWSPINPSH